MKYLRFVVVALTLLCTTSVFAQFTSGGTRAKETAQVVSNNGPQKGYSGSVELGYGIGLKDWYGSSRLTVTTVHGYQFNPYLFVGGGIGISAWFNYETVAIPVFADVRGTLPLGSSIVSLFADFRLGYSPFDIYGVYVSPTVGVRVGRSKAATFSLGYEMVDNSYGGAFNFRVGYEW
jgi:hypothetical protein